LLYNHNHKDKNNRRHTVKLTIEGGKIVDVQPDSGEALEQVLSKRIIAGQSLLVDINTGATISSKAFLKAVEEALSPLS